MAGAILGFCDARVALIRTMQFDGMVLGLKAGGENKEKASNEAVAPVQSGGQDPVHDDVKCLVIIEIMGLPIGGRIFSSERYKVLSKPIQRADNQKV
jgi:hypothetical protein